MLHLFEISKKRVIRGCMGHTGHKAIFFSTRGKLLDSSALGLLPARLHIRGLNFAASIPPTCCQLEVKSFVWICCILCVEATCKVNPLNSTLCWLM